MTRLGVSALSALVVVTASCASSKSASQDTPSNGEAAAATSGQATSTGQPTARGPSAADRQQATADLANARARLQEAQHELDLARSESAAANSDVNVARAQMERASKANDSIAQARAAEVARAAETRQQTGELHLDYATKLVAARQADVDAAQLGARESASALAVSGASSSGTAQSASAQDAARTRASELGQVALEAQRRWEEAAQRARAFPSGAASDTR